MRSSVASATCSSLPERRMRILVISSHYPPAVTGGYERECAAAVGHLRREHEVVVLTSRRSRRLSPAEPNLRRVLSVLPGGWRGSLMAPAVARRTAKLVEATIEEIDPDLIYFWNGAQLPLAAMVAASRSGVPLAYRVCEHWFARSADQFARHLAPGDRGLRFAWAQLSADHLTPSTSRSHREASRDDRLEQPVPEGGNHDPSERCSAVRGGDLPGAAAGDVSPAWCESPPPGR